MKTSRSVRRIAAVHDLSGVGRVSLTVVIPILSTMGFDVCPLPTAILSNHTQYENFTFLDLTDEMPAIIDHWEKLGVDFEAIYTGYLGSPRQIRIVADFIERFRTPDTLVVVDPVLGDNGRLYNKITDEMVREMRTLAARADVLTPNLTELFALLGEPFRPECTDDELKAAITELTKPVPTPSSLPAFRFRVSPISPLSLQGAERTAVPGRSPALIFPPTIPARATPSRASSRGASFRATASPLRSTAQRSSFCRGSAPPSATRLTTAKGFFSNACSRTCRCRFNRPRTNSSEESACDEKKSLMQLTARRSGSRMRPGTQASMK